jgi:prefoldin alpha subunit
MATKVDQKELQEKVLAYRLLESRIDSLLKQREFLANKLVELHATLESVDEIEESKEDVLFPLGSTAYTFGKVTDKDKMIVEVGAGVALEKNFTEARDVLNERKSDIESALTALQRNIQEVSESLQTLEPQIQNMIEKQQSQQSQQLQQNVNQDAG